jgi:serine acetyltransferase
LITEGFTWRTFSRRRLRHDKARRIYAGATILGRIVVGSGSTIGGNVWLTEDVPPNSFVTQATVRSKISPR